MIKNNLFRPALLIAAMTLSAMAAAESKTGDEKASAIKWSVSTGLGYDSNAYQAPSSAYVDYAALPAGSNPIRVPDVKSGFFVPYEAKVEVEKTHSRDNKLIGSAALDGSFYLGGLSNANEYNVGLNGGVEHVMNREGKSEDTIYAGAIIGKHKQIYVDHDTGLGKTSTLTGADISGRYSYTSMGIEGAYKHRIGKFDYGFNGQYVLNDYEDPVVVTQEDHSYLTVGADADLALAAQTRLNISLEHSVRDYSKRKSRNAQGALLNANPLLKYTYDAFGITLRHRISPEWLAYADFDIRKRADNNVGYNDYDQNRIGGRILFEQGRIKGRLALHHWERDYPNGFAFDKPIGGAKTYSGNDLKLNAELEQGKNSALWAELVYDAQTSTDLRYDYVRTLLMAGMKWAY